MKCKLIETHRVYRKYNNNYNTIFFNNDIPLTCYTQYMADGIRNNTKQGALFTVASSNVQCSLSLVHGGLSFHTSWRENTALKQQNRLHKTIHLFVQITQTLFRYSILKMISLVKRRKIN